MKITPSVIRALRAIDETEKRRGYYNKHAMSGSLFAIRAPTLEKLEKAGLITSARPFAGSYHTVNLTDAGRSALARTAA